MLANLNNLIRFLDRLFGRLVNREPVAKVLLNTGVAIPFSVGGDVNGVARLKMFTKRHHFVVAFFKSLLLRLELSLELSNLSLFLGDLSNHFMDFRSNFGKLFFSRLNLKLDRDAVIDRFGYVAVCRLGIGN